MSALPEIPGFSGDFTDSPDALDPMARASGPFRHNPRAIARPRRPEDVSALLETAGREGWSLVPRGAGTGMPGGNVGDGIVVDLNGLDEGPQVDRDSRTVTVGVGVVASRVQAAARQVGLDLPPLPSSADRCTIGGMIANNAAGARSFRHGASRDWVVGLEGHFASGESFALEAGGDLPTPLSELHRDLVQEGQRVLRDWPEVRKNSSGYGLDRFLPDRDGLALMVGSEGTLGLFHRARLRLREAPSRHRTTLVSVPDPVAMAEVIETADQTGAAACEFFSRAFLDLAKVDEHPDFGELSLSAYALLLVEHEGTGDEVSDRASDFLHAVESRQLPSRRADHPEAQERLWKLRKAASPTIAAAAERGLHSTQFMEDSVVPREHLPRYLEGIDRILREAGFEYVAFGHAGDGNVHVNPLIDLSESGWRDRVWRALDGVTDLVSSLGGTLAGEHGDGRLRAPLLSRIWSPAAFEAFAEVKRRLDPAKRLNPGVILPLPGQDPLDGLWADPERLQEGSLRGAPASPPS